MAGKAGEDGLGVPRPVSAQVRVGDALEVERGQIDGRSDGHLVVVGGLRRQRRFLEIRGALLRIETIVGQASEGIESLGLER